VTAWSNDELGRAVTTLNAAVDRLTQAIANLDARFVPREVYEANRKADRADVQRVIDEQETSHTSFRNYLLLPALSMVVAAITTAALVKGLHL
jgi:outer membrane murein-binding lipoprotein Lpp